MTTDRLRRPLSALIALAAVFALSSCGPRQVGTAAIVDGQVITVNELQGETRAYVDVIPSADTGAAQLRILERMLLSRVIDKAARTAGVSVSTAAVATQRDQTLRSVGGRTKLVEALSQQQQPVVVAPSAVDRWVRDRLLFTQIATKAAGGGDPSSQAASDAASQALIAASESMKIRVNPRYGTWDPTRGVQSVISGGLSSTVDQLKAPASGG